MAGLFVFQLQLNFRNYFNKYCDAALTAIIHQPTFAVELLLQLRRVLLQLTSLHFLFGL